MISVDLGCGNNKQPRNPPVGMEVVGIDIMPPPVSAADYVCNLGFERIPLPDDFADQVTAFHFIEHVPFCAWFTKDDEAHSKFRVKPMIYLFNEIWRILKHGGIFHIEVPLYPSVPAFQDPTHVSFWTTETFNYFSGDYYGFHELYEHTSRFEKKSIQVRDAWLGIIDLQAIKNLSPDAPYELVYER